jgi:hypothetical protein
MFRLWNRRLEENARRAKSQGACGRRIRLDRDRHHFAVGREIEEFPGVAAPQRLASPAKRHLLDVVGIWPRLMATYSS